ncbi:uncharacterized protein LOC101855780 [Aplysia californica]|uniref:Uncharacterized protein LOC101855780 n=1 Tax=Aplysia californica TaxID=6500 RepID=A0ABM0ZX79_APLCA|nr:uncharacterized protein LOC101855780 [Aplysia californica]XP_012936373.1 uncharacterized protein LOC101855780 [Aplysia californica]XP_012936374.1 uncharacterized protein LOC101855780 [Aplysia californica]
MSHIFKEAANVRNLALAAGGILFLRHLRKNQQVYALEKPNSPSPCASPRSKPCNAGTVVDESSLQLRQVQVMFRHGARTPLHLLPKVDTAEYDTQLVMREHQASLFPYERMSIDTGMAVSFGAYQNHHVKNSLKGGAYTGALTGYGKDQMYALGRRLQASYRDRLALHDYDPAAVYVLSTNIQRTVQSARCVLAGFFGKDKLTEYARRCHSPIHIYISSDEEMNILIPDTHNCPVLKKVNHAAIIHSDSVPHMKKDRLKIEDQIESFQEFHMKAVEKIQKKVSHQNEIYKTTRRGPCSMRFNQQRRPYLHDPDMYPLTQERGRAAEKVTHFWADVLSRHPQLGQSVTEDDMKALVYMKRLEVEEFQGKFQSGYRYTFHFERNPYFYNDMLVKEVYSPGREDVAPSWSSEIRWKPCGNLLPERKSEPFGNMTPSEYIVMKKAEEEKVKISEDGEEQSPPAPTSQEPKVKEPSEPDAQKTSGDDNSSQSKSFFSWLTRPAKEEEDVIGKVIREEIWPDPISVLQNNPPHEDPHHKKINFVFSRDDVVARVAHGWKYPTAVQPFQNTIEENATLLLFFAMTGQHEAERPIVTRLACGPLLGFFLTQAERQVKVCREGFKLCLYSAHDSTMAAVMESLGIWDNTWPPYGVEVRVELYQDPKSSEFYVKVLYNGQPKILRGQNKYLISWNEFKKLIRPYQIDTNEFKKVCASDILERIAKCLLQHDQDEVETEEIKQESETPAGM